jgi:glycosyltransferase 2 family protein
VIRVGIALGLAGLVLATGLIAYHGFGIVFAALASAGFGLLWASFFHFAPLIINAHAWQLLLAGRRRPSLAHFACATWLRESVNGLLPVARIGGEFVAVRYMVRHRLRTAPVVASVVVDMTLCVGAQFLYTMIGLALLMRYTGDFATAGSIALGLIVVAALVLVFVFVQRYGLFSFLGTIVHRLFGDRFARFVGGATALDRAVRVIYRRPRRLVACTAWQFVAWVAAAGEIWLALYFLGHAVSVGDAILIDAVIHAVSTAAFVIPGAFGVQEGAFMIVGNLLGLSPELSLALALTRRARDLLLFLPGLLVWQIQEGRRLLATA